jgi:hypothetical protein
MFSSQEALPQPLQSSEFRVAILLRDVFSDCFSLRQLALVWQLVVYGVLTQSPRSRRFK